jgi:hypothetical protein
VLQDFSMLSGSSQVLDAIVEARAFMSQQQLGEMLVLTDVSGTTFDQEVIDAIRALAEHNRPWVKASALIGVTPLMRIVYRVLVALTRREIRIFNTRSAAIAYLLEKRRAVSAPSTAAAASPRKP